MKNLVIGSAGQIGSAVKKILDCDGYDIANDQNPGGSYDVLHITIPFSDRFIYEVKKYEMMFNVSLIIIHSTVPVGTCDKIGSANIVYSPCRGVHPDLEKGIRTFTKYFTGKKSREAVKIFSEKIDGECMYSDSPRAMASLEAAKLWDTTQYGFNIVLEKAIYKYCEENELDFELIYTMFNTSYNEGYEELGLPKYKKYVLDHKPGKIGGHCIMPNIELLNHPIGKIIKDFNID